MIAGIPGELTMQRTSLPIRALAALDAALRALVVVTMSGMVVVDANRHRLGEVEDLVVDDEGRVRLLSVVSGGVLGLDTRTRAIPIEAVTRVDDRVHVDLYRAAAYSRLR